MLSTYILFAVYSLQERNGGDPIPMVVRACIQYLEETGLDVEGIFRRTTVQTLVRQAKARFNEGTYIQYCCVMLIKSLFNTAFCRKKSGF